LLNGATTMNTVRCITVMLTNAALTDLLRAAYVEKGKVALLQNP
jgi:hypothetical protein